MTSFKDNRYLRDITDATSIVFSDTAAHEGFSVSIKGGDRHGSYVWEAFRQDTLNRTVVLGLTEVPPSTSLHTELIAGADDNVHFVRRTTYSGPLTGPAISKVLKEAFRAAKSLAPEDLTEEYVLPRGPQLTTTRS